MELNQDFKEFIALLNAHKVRFLVIGGYAVNYHGYPRYTKLSCKITFRFRQDWNFTNG